jgi:hypothetical protein
MRETMHTALAAHLLGLAMGMTTVVSAVPAVVRLLRMVV